MTPADDSEQRERQLHRFKRLFGELLGGEIRRNNFEPWEVALLLDLETCQLPSRRRMEILRQYERAVEKQLESGPGPPLKLSQFLSCANNAASHSCLPNGALVRSPDRQDL